MIELGQILVRLIERTAEGKLKWSRTARDDSFATSLDAISIVIREVTLGIRSLSIFDESGNAVESLGPLGATAQQQGQMERLYTLARRSALDVDATLEKLAKALEL